MKIGYRVVLVCSDLMENGKDVSFEIPVPVPFKTPQEAEAHESSFSAKMVRKADEVVINLYRKDKHDPEPIETIRWKNWNLYKCTMIRDSSVGKAIINPIEDEEPPKSDIPRQRKQLLLQDITWALTVECVEARVMNRRLILSTA